MTRSDSRPGAAARASALAGRVRRKLAGSPADAVTMRFERQHQRIAVLERELARVSPQLAALEERVAGLVADSAVAAGGSRDDAGDPPDSAALLREVRAEHRRVRARITAATRYEERLERLEDAVSALEAQT